MCVCVSVLDTPGTLAGGTRGPAHTQLATLTSFSLGFSRIAATCTNFSLSPLSCCCFGFFYFFFAQFPWPVWPVWGLGMQGNSHDLITQFSYCQRCRSETSFTAKCMWVQRGICLMVVVSVVVPLWWLCWLQCEVRGDVAALSVSRGYYH